MSTGKNKNNNPIGNNFPWKLFLNNGVELASMLLWFAPFVILVKYQAYSALWVPIIGLFLSIIIFWRLVNAESGNTPAKKSIKMPIIDVDLNGNKLKEGDLVCLTVTVGERPLKYTEYVTFQNGILGVKCRGEWLPLSAFDYLHKDYEKYGRSFRSVELSVPK